MNLSKQDGIATALVAAAGVLYGLWAAGSAPPVLDSARGTGVVILALGFAASAIAVVPGFDALLHGNKIYLACTSAIGLVALFAGVQTLFASSGLALTLLMGATSVLWLIATTHHSLLAGASGPRLASSPTGVGVGPHEPQRASNVGPPR
jgi:hypothetical protein